MALRALPSVAPSAPAASSHDIRAIASVLSARAGPVLSLSGAGLSTASGLLDYRSPGRHASPAAAAAAERARTTHSSFVGSSAVRARYWARSFAGYPKVLRAQPNAAHAALAALHGGAKGEVLAVTQNVDGLSQKAGLEGVIELHGTLHHARCLKCGHRESREAFQRRMAAENGVEGGGGLDGGALAAGDGDRARPDGDVVLDDHGAFAVPTCAACGAGDAGLAPDLVFHGGAVPRAVVHAARDAVDRCGALVVVGSSVTTYSAYSLVLRAKEAGKKVVVLNFGPGRADGIADLLVEGELSSVLPGVVREMGVGAWAR